MLRRIDWDYVIWAILALPALAVAYRIWGPFEAVSYRQLSFRTAEASAYLFIISLMATPLQLLMRGRFGTRWLVKKRRYIGVAALGYGLLHTLFYFLHSGGLWPGLAKTLQIDVWTGWLVLLLLLPPGWTSRDSSVRNLGRKWKQVQFLVYPAAVLTFIHWGVQFGGQVIQEAVMYFTPLAILTIWRIKRARRMKNSAAA
ncbi:MAG: ferric reductase-like transmembrane domain-containing protein [Mangrovicoccus sp.]